MEHQISNYLYIDVISINYLYINHVLYLYYIIYCLYNDIIYYMLIINKYRYY